MILGVIVTHNPITEQLNENIGAVIDQVDELLIVDNGSRELLVESPKATIVKLGENKGIAYALNRGLSYAMENDYKYLFTLDQDSVCSTGLVKSLLKTISGGIDIAMVGPKIVDLSRGAESTKKGCKSVTRLITSGALCDVTALNAVGGFNNNLFIDEVDHDMCYRLISNGYLIVQNDDVELSHELGKVELRKTFYGKTILVNNHSAFRLYYIGRNQVYMIRTYRNSIPGITKLQVRDLLSRYKQILLGENEKMEKLLSLTKGIMSGFFFKG